MDLYISMLAFVFNIKTYYHSANQLFHFRLETLLFGNINNLNFWWVMCATNIKFGYIDMIAIIIWWSPTKYWMDNKNDEKNCKFFSHLPLFQHKTLTRYIIGLHFLLSKHRITGD